MSQVSPDGRYVLSTFAGPSLKLLDSYYVTNFLDYRFLQVFFPTRGILAWYDRTTGLRTPLPGADDPKYVQTDGVWSPDGKYIVFARAEARDPRPPGQERARMRSMRTRRRFSTISTASHSTTARAEWPSPSWAPRTTG
jgi:hypothetical protein